MNLYKLQKYEKKFSGWSAKEISLAAQMFRFIENINMSRNDFLEYSAYARKKNSDYQVLAKQFFYLRQQWFKYNGPKCPKCGELMSVGSVNAGKRDAIDDKTIKSVFTCPKVKECGYQKFNKEDPRHFIEKYETGFKQYAEQLNTEDVLLAQIDEDIIDKFKHIATALFQVDYRSSCKQEINLPPCPECNRHTLGLFSVNTDPGNQVGEKLRSQLFCHHCGYDRFSKRSPGQWLKKLKRGI